MPPKRRSNTGAATSTRSQSTLSFNNKPSRVTKPSITDSSSKKATSKLSESAQDEVIETTSISTTPAPVTVELETPEPDFQNDHVEVTIKQPKSKPRKAIKKDPREAAAEKVTDAQLKKYWKAEEDSRLAPRVHQRDVPLHEKILRHFDLSSQYGPCIGIQRAARWKRANMLGLEPPVEVLAVLLREEDKKTSQGCGKLAYIDELGGGQIVLVE